MNGLHDEQTELRCPLLDGGRFTSANEAKMIAPRKILFPSDFSSDSEAALHHACKFAEQFQAELLLLHVVSEKARTKQGHDVSAEVRRQSEEKLMCLLDANSSLQLKPRLEVREGPAAREIVRYARDEEVDLIVMGTHGRTGLARAALGSVAESVLRSAACPVMVVRRSEWKGSESTDSVVQFREARDDEGPALDLLERAISAQATDIHLDPIGNDDYLVRFRIDGRLTRFGNLGRDVAEHLIQRFKLLANLDIADPFHPMEGRLNLPPTFSEVEARLTSSPVEGGEAVAMRLFFRGNLVRQLTELGFSEAAWTSVDKILRNGEGIVLITGPTGSGKTTTVYSMLAELGDESRNVVSIEDPVEYKVPFVRQLAVDERHGVTMTAGLKTLLRMDPDVVFVGEIRDIEAADIAMRAASCGRYVFSTLHTRDVASTVTACRDLHIDNRSLAANLAGIISQRLVRRLCTECRKATSIEDGHRDLFVTHGLEVPSQLYRPQGCDRCAGSGYRGRIGLFEAAWIDDKARSAIARGCSEAELRDLLRSTGVQNLATDALDKVGKGLTCLAEALNMSAV